MIKEIVKDTFLLSRRCEAATLDDLQTVQDLQDTLQAHADHCVGMAANMIRCSETYHRISGWRKLCINAESCDNKNRR